MNSLKSSEELKSPGEECFFFFNHQLVGFGVLFQQVKSLKLSLLMTAKTFADKITKKEKNTKKVLNNMAYELFPDEKAQLVLRDLSAYLSIKLLEENCRHDLKHTLDFLKTQIPDEVNKDENLAEVLNAFKVTHGECDCKVLTIAVPKILSYYTQDQIMREQEM